MELALKNEESDELDEKLRSARSWYEKRSALDEVKAGIRLNGPRSFRIHLPTVIALLEDNDDWVVTAAAEVLGELADPRGVQPLLALAFRTRGEAIWAIGREAYSRMEVRFATIEALGQLRDERSRRALEWSRDSDREHPLVRARARAMLAGWPSAA